MSIWHSFMMRLRLANRRHVADQWTKKELDRLEALNKPPLEINRIKSKTGNH